jgi:hypothetical protein
MAKENSKAYKKSRKTIDKDFNLNGRLTGFIETLGFLFSPMVQYCCTKLCVAGSL